MVGPLTEYFLLCCCSAGVGRCEDTGTVVAATQGVTAKPAHDTQLESLVDEQVSGLSQQRKHKVAHARACGQRERQRQRKRQRQTETERNNNNNEYLKRLTRTGPKRLHVLYKYIVKIQRIQHLMHTHTHAHTHTKTKRQRETKTDRQTDRHRQTSRERSTCTINKTI